MYLNKQDVGTESYAERLTLTWDVFKLWAETGSR